MNAEIRDDKSLTDLNNLIEAAEQRIHDEQRRLLELVEQRGRLTVLLDMAAEAQKGGGA